MRDETCTCKNCGYSWGSASIPSEGVPIFHRVDGCQMCGLRPSQRLIPVRKIQHQRFGQLLFNALRVAYGLTDLGPRDDGLATWGQIEDKLWNIENDELEKVVRDFLTADREEE